MNITLIFTNAPYAVFIVVGLLGLIVGSFLNVVIYRLPIMMKREWRVQCIQLLTDEAGNNSNHFWNTRFLKKLGASKRQLRKIFRATSLKPSVPLHNNPFNLSRPRSHCPHCGHQITVLENIPIASFIWQRGKCTACHQAISIRYPLIEALSAILAIIIAWHFGFGWQLAFALVLTWALLAASIIDFNHQLLPDNITLPLLWLGLLCNSFGLYTSLEESLIGAIVGYLVLWSVYWLFKLATGKEGMGYGDFKLLAMLGAWLGWQAVPMILFISSLAGAVVGISLILLRGHDKNVPIPFGPYLASAGWISLLWGETLTAFF
ncbi:MAG: prepilin peptidase [Candidatus Parabeggiatoa sp. nov. 1]|nr:MAG: prepilin peptidase [Gammaproteobacteria bacterium]